MLIRGHRNGDQAAIQSFTNEQLPNVLSASHGQAVSKVTLTSSLAELIAPGILRSSLVYKEPASGRRESERVPHTAQLQQQGNGGGDDEASQQIPPEPSDALHS